MTAIRELIRSSDPDLPITDVQTMSDREHKSLWGRRILAWLFGIPATVSGIMAFAGIYGVISYTVGQRTQEIGVRMALGARRQNVLAMVMGQGLRLTLAGVVLGFIAAIALSRVIASLLYNVSPTDAATFVEISVLVTVVALIACYIPACRAARVDPMVALRYE
jgi:ABC-type antimicrobial peptide transport system permease subunit